MEKIARNMKRVGVWNPEAEGELKAFWKYGIEAIGNKKLREIVIGFLEVKTPVQFFYEANDPNWGKKLQAGKDPHHLEWQNKRFGMLRNTTERCMLAPEMCRYVPSIARFTVDDPTAHQEKVDIVLSGTIISDTFKVNESGTLAGPTHGDMASRHWRSYATGQIPDQLVEAIADTVYWHYGVYTPGYREGIHLSPETWVVHFLNAFFAQKKLGKLFRPRVIE